MLIFYQFFFFFLPLKVFFFSFDKTLFERNEVMVLQKFLLLATFVLLRFL